MATNISILLNIGLIVFLVVFIPKYVKKAEELNKAKLILAKQSIQELTNQIADWNNVDFHGMTEAEKLQYKINELTSLSKQNELSLNSEYDALLNRHINSLKQELANIEKNAEPTV